MRAKALRTLAHRVPGLSRLTAAWHLANTAVFLLRARVGHVVTRFQQRKQKMDDGTVWTTVACRSLIAHPVDHFRSVDASTSTLNRLRKTLDAAAVSHEVVVTPPELARVAVDDLSAALRALGQSTDAWYQHRGGRTRTLTQTTTPETNGSVLVFQAWATHAGAYLAGADVGIELVLQTRELQPTSATDFPIDAVITWVDGSDPLWQAKKCARRKQVQGELHATADNDARYESMDELKYCLKSIEMYAPWIRNIFLVTDAQIPVWLDPEDTRITVVDHTDIFDNHDDLPTFNSHAIEARLHHIPGLAEHWIYFNDDVFLARALPPSFFFASDGRPKVFLAEDRIDPGPRTDADVPVLAAAKNNRKLLAEITQYEMSLKLKHVPHPQVTSLTLELEKLLPGSFIATAGAPFRSPEDLSIVSSLLPHYALASGKGISGLVAHFYADVGSLELHWRIPLMAEKSDADVVCLNATEHPPRGSEAIRGLFRE